MTLCVGTAGRAFGQHPEKLAFAGEDELDEMLRELGMGRIFQDGDAVGRDDGLAFGQDES